MLLITPELASLLADSIKRFPEDSLTTLQEIDVWYQLAQDYPTLKQIADLAFQVLDEQGFVHIKGLPTTEATKLFPALGCLIGKLFIDPFEESAIIKAHVSSKQSLMGNQLRCLPMHTDYSMAAEPPQYTMSLCIEPDPTTDLGNVLISDVEAACFGVETAPDFERFHTIPLPFAARNANGNPDLLESPIISRNAPDGGILVRYHRSRIRQGFILQNQEPTPEQSSMIIAFEQLATRSAQTIQLQSGDMLIIDNHRCVHARTRCSIQVNKEGETKGRKMHFLFAH